MSKTRNAKQYDLEDRTLQFAKQVRRLVKRLPQHTGNWEDGKQAVRSSGSVGANYIEANEALSKKDFIHRIKICRKEAKETKYWLQLLDIGNNEELDRERQEAVQEAHELMMIFGAILKNSQ